VAKTKETLQPTYSTALARLNELVVALEAGQQDVDQMLAIVAEAETLVAFCRMRLRTAGTSLDEILQRMKTP